MEACVAAKADALKGVVMVLVVLVMEEMLVVVLVMVVLVMVVLVMAIVMVVELVVELVKVSASAVLVLVVVVEVEDPVRVLVVVGVLVLEDVLMVKEVLVVVEEVVVVMGMVGTVVLVMVKVQPVRSCWGNRHRRMHRLDGCGCNWLLPTPVAQCRVGWRMHRQLDLHRHRHRHRHMHMHRHRHMHWHEYIQRHVHRHRSRFGGCVGCNQSQSGRPRILTGRPHHGDNLVAVQHHLLVRFFHEIELISSCGGRCSSGRSCNCSSIFIVFIVVFHWWGGEIIIQLRALSSFRLYAQILHLLHSTTVPLLDQSRRGWLCSSNGDFSSRS
jgi:hypothetical protein